jgi:hypothetical protein
VLPAAGLALHLARPYGLRGLRVRLLGGLICHPLLAHSHDNDDLSSGVSFSLVPESVRDITQGEAPIDDRRDLAGFD